MLQAVISAVFLFSFVTALFQGTMESSCARLLSAPEQAVELIVSIGCGICFWSGVMEVARQSGLLKGLAKLFSPILSLLFPKCKKDSPAAQAICLNLAANLMGLAQRQRPPVSARFGNCKNPRPTPRLPPMKRFWSFCSILPPCSSFPPLPPCCGSRRGRQTQWRFCPQCGFLL